MISKTPRRVLAERGEVLFEYSFEVANRDVARTVLFFRAFFAISKLDRASKSSFCREARKLLWLVSLSLPL